MPGHARADDDAVLRGSALRDRLGCIDEHVQEDLPEASLVGEHRGSRLEPAHQQRAVAHLVPRHADRLLEHRIDVDGGAQIVIVSPREGAHVADDVADLLRSRAGVPQHVGQVAQLRGQAAGGLRVGRRVTCQVREPIHHTGQVGQDVGEGIVDLVRDARGERAQRHDPLQVHHAELQHCGPLPLDRVLDRPHEHRAVEAPLDQVVLRPVLQRMDSGRLVVERGEDHDGRMRSARRLELAEQRQTVAVRQPVVDQGAVVTLLRQGP